MTSSVEALEQHYDRLLAGFPHRNAPDYSSLVVPTGNAQEPVHRWFHVKEAYSHALVPRLLKDYDLVGAGTCSVIDPFSGSGTTATSLADLVRGGELSGAQVLGIEQNPFLHLLSATKSAAAQYGAADFEAFAAGLVATASSAADTGASPTLSTFANTDYFSAANLNGLLRLRDAIASESERSDPVLLNLARVCLAAAIEPASRLRRDGRTLRYVAEKRPVNPITAFSDRAVQIADDVSRPLTAFEASVVNGDARDISTHANARPHDAVIFSPPYPNNIDYSEIYKLENWLLGLVSTQGEFANLRRRTLRSHGSLRWVDEYQFKTSKYASDIDELLRPLLATIPSDRYFRARTQLVLGYFDDMLAVVQGAALSLKSGGILACVVGNSMHGKAERPLLVASDVLIARLCEFVGLSVESIDIARTPSRRRMASAHLRESVVVARKTGS